MDEHSSISPVSKLRLSQAELYVLMRLLRATGIPGIDFARFQSPSSGLSPEVLSKVVETALQALIARDYLVQLSSQEASTQASPLSQDLPPGQADKKQQHIGISEGLITLLRACAFPAQSLSLAWYTASGARLLWLHARGPHCIAVTSPQREIYQFLALPAWERSIDVVTEALGLQDQPLSSEPLATGKLRLDTLAEARAAIESNELIEALTDLTDGGLPASTAQSLLVAIGECTAVARLNIICEASALEARSQQSTTQVILVTPHTCFMLQPLYTDEVSYEVQAVSASEIRTWLAAVWSQPSYE